MVMTLFAVACLYLTLNAAFIGVIQVLVYAGAIMVLFLFVIMLLNLETAPRLGGLDLRKVVAFVLGVAVLAQLLVVVALRLDVAPAALAPAEAAAEAASAERLGVALLTEHAFSLEMIGVLLLAATIGAVLLAKKRFV
jgi:NADH-quinone oxidoreductase subunit J